MHTLRYLALLPFFWGCNQTSENLNLNSSGACACIAPAGDDTTHAARYQVVRGALLGTRFNSLEELRTVVQIEYHGGTSTSDGTLPSDCYVRLRHCSNGTEVTNILAPGITQRDLHKAGYNGAFRDRLAILFRCPFAVANRKDLEKIYNLSRWEPDWFGEGDVAFFDIAKTSAEHINTPDLAYGNTRDTTEKGYLNSFNHITAQAFITSCFSQELADFIGDTHERYNHPELITGKFTEAQIKDLGEGPVDNYVDLINNVWGQKLGKQLREKYGINRETNWTPQLLADYLNDLQRYYSWAFQVGFKPFRPEDEVVVRFSNKINAIMKGRNK
jgi:hypothetical protein